MADIKFPRKIGEVVILSSELCELWQKSNKLRNPFTNRPLKKTSKIIKDIDNQCKLLAKQPLTKRKRVSSKEISSAKHTIGGTKFIAENIYGDGSCFFHSVARLLNPNYAGKRTEGIELRHKIAENLAFRDYLEISNGIFAKVSLIEQYDLEVNPRDFDTLPIEKIIMDRPNYKILKLAVEKNYKKFRDDFMSKKTYANENMVDFSSKVLGVNIIILGSESGRLTSARRVSKTLPTIFLYNLGQYHYEPLVRKDGKTIFSWVEASQILKDETFLNV